jgi:hypothetical protein
MERLAPDGTVPNHVAVIVTEEENPFNDVRVTGTEMNWPWGRATEGVALMEKSGMAEVVVGVAATTSSVVEV